MCQQYLISKILVIMPMASPNFKPIYSPPLRHPIPIPLTRTLHRIPQHPRFTVLKCMNSDNNNNDNESARVNSALSGIVDAQVEELLSRDENRVLLDGLEKASQRVERAKRELAEIERQELEAKQMRVYINELESRASEIAESQREILEARAMVEQAERSLSMNLDRTQDEAGFGDSIQVGRDEERLESVKAASLSAIIGTLAGLPISFSQATTTSQLILPLAINFISSALFGITYRYTVRRDLDDTQLKTGACAAFAIVKGLSALGQGPPLELNPESFLSHAFDGALYVSESFLIFTFAAVGLDYCFKMRFLSPFPVLKPESKAEQ